MNNDLGKIVQVSDINSDGNNSSFDSELTEVNDQLFFTVGDEIYVSDGTEGVANLVPNVPSRPKNLAEFDGQLYFSADAEGSIGAELYVTDGTTGGTRLVRDINSGVRTYRGLDGFYSARDSSPNNFIEFNDQLYFTATGDEAGRELYVTDGTEAGTILIADLNFGFSGIRYRDFNGSYPDDFTELNGKLYFAATGNETEEGDRDKETEILELTREDAGRELYVTDGTERGTKLVKDIFEGDSGIPSYVIDDVSNYLNDSNPRNITEFNDKLYFTATDSTSGRELFVTDGTEGGTGRFADINPGSDSSIEPGDRPNFTEFNGKLYFIATDGTSGSELFVTDGTRNGTNLVKDINPGSSGSSVVVEEPPYYDSPNFTEFNGKLYFRANDGTSGAELYVTDGTADGTKLVADINPGSGSSFEVAEEPYLGRPDFTEFNGKLYFRANDGTSGTELFVTDGTAEGTKLVADINPGSGSSSPTNLTVFNNELFFNADNGTSGRELFKLTVDDTMTQPSNPIPDMDGAVVITQSLNPILGNSNLPGTDGNDGIAGGLGSDVLNGGLGNDALDGGAGSDNLDGGKGTDTAVYQFAPAAVRVSLDDTTATDGFSDTDFLSNIENAIASEFDDTLIGNSGNNSLTGRGGNDAITGGEGNDFITGGMGADILSGGEGGDRFVYLNPNEGGDTITDFVVNADKIAVLSSGFGGGLSAGELPEGSFAFGSEATDSEQRFVFDPASNELFFDMDGSGAAPQQLIATVGGEAKMSAGDIMLL